MTGAGDLTMTSNRTRYPTGVCAAKMNLRKVLLEMDCDCNMELKQSNGNLEGSLDFIERRVSSNLFSHVLIAEESISDALYLICAAHNLEFATSLSTPY